MPASRTLILSTGVVLLFSLFVSACKDDNPLTGESPSNVIFPAAGISYGRHMQPLFDQTCALVGCHDDGQHQSALKLTNYGNLMFNSLPVVIRSKPDESVLVWRVEGRVGQRMPPYGNPLNQNQINGIRTWVAEGAINN